MLMTFGSLLVVLLTAPGILPAQPTEVLAHYQRALADRAAGRLSDALASLSALAGEPAFEADTETAIRVWEQSASIHRARLHFGGASEAYERGLRIAGASPSARSHLLLGKGAVLFLRGQPDPARDVLYESARLAGKDGPLRAAILRAMALLHVRQEDGLAGRRALETALPLAVADFALRASILAELAAVCARLGDHRSARAALEEDAQPRLPAPVSRTGISWS